MLSQMFFTDGSLYTREIRERKIYQVKSYAFGIRVLIHARISAITSSLSRSLRGS